VEAMQPNIERVLFSQEEIKRRVNELGDAITRDYAGKDLLVIGILKGSVIFLADLLRAIDVELNIDFMAVSSYGAYSESSGVVRILKDLNKSIEGRHVLVVEDIVDTGLTLHYLLDILKAREPASIEVCVFLDKPSRRKIQVQVRYSGFNVADEFVVGYGLDFDERYRNLPEVCILKTE